MAHGTSCLYTPKNATCAASLLHRPALPMHAEWHMAHLVCTLQKLQHAPHLCCTSLLGPCMQNGTQHIWSAHLVNC